MIRNVNKVHHEIRLLGIKIFSSDYTVTDLEESDEFEEVEVTSASPWDKWTERRSKRQEQIMFLEKLYRQGNDKTNLDDNLF